MTDSDIEQLPELNLKKPFYYHYKKWHGTANFRKSAIYFDDNDTYTFYPEDSVAYDRFWDQEENYIKNGFTYDGQRIAGLHYLYLNYCRIWNKRLRKYAFPDFRANDAEWFLAIEHDLGLGPWNNNPDRPVGHVDGKTRQVGHSLKAVVPLLYYMNFIRGCKCYLGAVEEKYATKTLKMYMHYHDHLYEHTALGKGWIEKQKNKYYKTGFFEVINGQNVEKGYLSELTIVSFQDSAEKGVGGGCDLFIIEEAGLFEKVLDAVVYISDACKDGDITTGNILVYGAAGNLDSCVQFAKLCKHPQRYGFAGYPNLHERGKENDMEAYFIPNHSARPPYIDADGNPDSEGAIKARDTKNANLRKKDFKKWAQRMSQEPNTLKEMFDMRSHTRFAKEILEPHISFLEARQDAMGTRVSYWYDDEGKPRYSFTVPDEQQPIMDYPYGDLENKEGCIMMYEFPPPGKPPGGLYISAIDSYNQDDASTTSMGHIIIYKQQSTLSGENTSRVVVAEYLGRPRAGKHEFYKKCAFLLQIYNATCLIENEDVELTPWFFNQGLDHLLANQPDIIRNIMPGSNVKRTKGIHAATPLILAAENKIQRYIEEKIGFYYNAEGEVIGVKYGVTRIPSLGICRELLAYISDPDDKDMNYDRERTFGWLLLYEEEIMTKPIEDEYDPNVANFLVNVTENIQRAARELQY